MGQTISSYIYGEPRVYNWKRGLLKPTDKYVSFSSAPSASSVDLTSTCKFSQVYDQGKLGSCTANAICGAYSFDELNGNTEETTAGCFTPSRLYLYYKERQVENTTGEDNGAIIGDGVTVLQTNGVCSEEKWPYDISKFADQPPNECDKDAKSHCSIDQRRVAQKLDDMKNCIENKLPFVFGFDVFESFETLPADFVVPLPKEGEKQLGGHAILAVGFDDEKKLFKIRNSWGEDWGNKGHFYMPYDYISNPAWCADFWVVSKVRDLEALSVPKPKTWSQVVQVASRPGPSFGFPIL